MPGNGSNVYLPPHQHASVNGASNDGRYPRDQLLSIFRNLKDAGDLSKDVQSVLVGGWAPTAQISAGHPTVTSCLWHCLT